MTNQSHIPEELKYDPEFYEWYNNLFRTQEEQIADESEFERRVDQLKMSINIYEKHRAISRSDNNSN